MSMYRMPTIKPITEPITRQGRRSALRSWAKGQKPLISYSGYAWVSSKYMPNGKVLKK
jgi:hypothetical protein